MNTHNDPISLQSFHDSSFPICLPIKNMMTQDINFCNNNNNNNNISNIKNNNKNNVVERGMFELIPINTNNFGNVFDNSAGITIIKPSITNNNCEDYLSSNNSLGMISTPSTIAQRQSVQYCDISTDYKNNNHFYGHNNCHSLPPASFPSSLPPSHSQVHRQVYSNSCFCPYSYGQSYFPLRPQSCFFYSQQCCCHSSNNYHNNAIDNSLLDASTIPIVYNDFNSHANDTKCFMNNNECIQKNIVPQMTNLQNNNNSKINGIINNNNNNSNEHDLHFPVPQSLTFQLPMATNNQHATSINSASTMTTFCKNDTNNRNQNENNDNNHDLIKFDTLGGENIVTKDAKNSPVVYKCPLCNKQYKHKGNLKGHYKIHTNQAIECSYCHKKFGRIGNYKEHLRTHTGEAPFACKLCNKAFTQRHCLKDHERIHSGDKPYVCEICWKRFAVKNNLKIHLRAHSGERPYQCHACHRKFTQKGSLNQHIKSMHPV